MVIEVTFIKLGAGRFTAVTDVLQRDDLVLIITVRAVSNRPSGCNNGELWLKPRRRRVTNMNTETQVLERETTTTIRIDQRECEPSRHSVRIEHQRKWQRVCRLDDLEPLWAEAALVSGCQVALVRMPDDTVYALDQRDPCARANVMARGIIGSRDGRPTVASPLHKQVYDLGTGICLNSEAASLQVYRAQVRNGMVMVEL